MRYGLVIVGFVLVVFAGLLATTPKAVPGPSVPRPVFPSMGGEVWIAAGTNTTGAGYAAGLGTMAAPFIGDLDFIKQRLPLLCRVHLLAGDYWTAGHWDSPLKSWQHWSGAGMNSTRVHIDRRFALPQDQSVFESFDNGITVEDVTLDASGKDGDEWQRNGLDLFGDHITVRRVRVINAVGNRALRRECFPIFVGIGSAVPQPLSRSLITECEVSDCHGDYITGINLNCQGVVSFCRVELPVIVDPSVSSGWTAYNSSGGENTLFIANVSEGGWFGYYTDTGAETNVSLVSNCFRNVQGGIVVNKYTTGLDGLNLVDNVIELATNSTPAHAGVGIGVVNFSTNQVFANIRISGNLVRYIHGDRLPGNGIQINSVPGYTNIHGVTLAGNIVATNLSTRVMASEVSTQ